MNKILIFGANGFIGYHLLVSLIQNTNHYVTCIDIENDRILDIVERHCSRARFIRYNILSNDDSDVYEVENLIDRHDIVIPLAAIARPEVYIENPLLIYELDFEANRKIVELSMKKRKRLIFPSTSEVYGMCTDSESDEENSNLITGPISKSRWIYSCCKQLMDRLIFAYGKKYNSSFTIFRPFNWVGPMQDRVDGSMSSRVLSQFISNILRNKNLQVVDGGKQKRCFIYIDEAIDALIRIIENDTESTRNKIFNIGNPKNLISIMELAERTLEISKKKNIRIENVYSKEYYGDGYQDIQNRVPSIERISLALNWKSIIDINGILERTLRHYSIIE